MTLKSFGCSFIYGNELADDQCNVEFNSPSQLTWPAHLSRHLGMQYQCYARPGAGNLQILEQILFQAVTSNKEDFFVVNWTWIDRFDYCNTAQSTNSDQSLWSSILPNDRDSLSQYYFKNLHSEYRDKLTALIYVNSAIDALKQKQIPFIMTYMDNLMYDRRWNTSPAVENLQNLSEPCMTQFEGQSFLDWSRKNGFKESSKWHPLDQAHAAAGDYMITVFDTQNKDVLAQQALS
jgi:hypothetical protein